MIRSSISPKWVESFLQKPFFERCTNHEFQKNELNRYCITCDASLCKYCIIHDSHTGHSILTINRYTYQNVVPLSEMEVYIDCEKIQPYKCNKKAVVSLNPLAHNGSDLPVKGRGNCYVCKRKLADGGRFLFCSIACKVMI
ncbi:hypothetical protein PHJA_000891800 [Phtheirospermum japonicum]|uniref:B box-type domain-containing protein n=1 Tax=Phtheirospermum japonicum TaxID=374723 RepID=A0A830BZP2_9LAMI|nr:hypothetical protein PHJA_000891800 [Phtheirospermum japonicum]